MKKQTIITGGRMSISRFRHALKLTHDRGYDVVLTFNQADKFIRFNKKITDNSCLIFKVRSQDDFLGVSSRFYDGVLLDLKGEDEKIVRPDIIICISKTHLADLINSTAVSRRFNLIDLDNEI